MGLLSVYKNQEDLYAVISNLSKPMQLHIFAIK